MMKLGEAVTKILIALYIIFNIILYHLFFLSSFFLITFISLNQT